MTDQSEHIDPESESLLAELWATPVGRRWVLKAGLGSAAAVAAELYGGAAVAAATKSKKAAVSDTSLHFVLGSVRGVTDLTLTANGRKIPLKRHTKESRAALKRKGGLWNKIDLSVLSHHVPAVPSLPEDRAMLVSVHGRRGRRRVVVAQLWHVPPTTTLALAKTQMRLTGSLKGATPSRYRLQKLGFRGTELTSPTEVVQMQRIVDQSSSASSLVMLHPQVATIDKTSAAVTTQLLGQTAAVTTLSRKIGQMHSNGQDFATQEQATNPDHTAAQIKIGDTTTTFTTIKLSDDKAFRSAAKDAVTGGIRAVRDDGSLGAVIDTPLVDDPTASTKTWVQPEGNLPTITRNNPSGPLGAGLEIKIKDEGLLHGTYTVLNGSYDNGRVPLKLYNNWVRWIWVYVQYLGKDGENLSLNPNATWPDTPYAQSLGLLPQVFTALGVPLWDTNTIEVDLNFPEAAHSARILFCGLGSNLQDGGWRQYFPDDAYPDRIAPTSEVLFPAIVTALLTIGLNAFALATDIDIAVTWKAVVDAVEGDVKAAFETISAAVAGTQRLIASEAAAATVAAGGATYEDVANNGFSTANIWSILLGLSSLIPKLIFGAAATGILRAVALTLAAEETATRFADAIPLIGEAIAVIEVLGDVATLAEVATETVAAPWVIENEVSLQYDATVTIKHDPRDGAGFPASAKSWRLEAKIDGASALSPITGATSDAGYNSARDLTVSVVAPFGGKQIQWSFVMLDGPLDAKGQPTGYQVGTGVSDQAPNDDPNNVFSDVQITITELPATITSSTVFQRQRTTAYRTASPAGYTWSSQVTPTGTVDNSPIQNVTGTTVATLAGVAGLVWLQGNRYYIRGVPLAEPGSTIALGGAVPEGYSRRPFLLFDAFVSRTDAGNHVLLEPDETTDAYHVRRVSLDSQTGSISWVPDVSHGTFVIPPSAAALHSSGRVVAVHTDAGRLSWLTPVQTARPPLAAYSAGPGSEIGLLQSPVALAVTNPGVVLVLEAGAGQVSSFDLNGTPVGYFQPASSSSVLRSGRTTRGPRRLGDSSLLFSMPLVSDGTYLDIAVDGANQIYVLYFTGDGNDPKDYRVDVYDQTGTPLNTNSAGVNIAHLAVDYWRSIYGANYDALCDLGTNNPHISTDLKVIEPSLSSFVPNNSPSASSALRDRRRWQIGGYRRKLARGA